MILMKSKYSKNNIQNLIDQSTPQNSRKLATRDDEILEIIVVHKSKGK